MHVFIWHYIGELTGSYHNEGGAVVVAETVERARELLEAREHTRLADDEQDPDVTYKLGGRKKIEEAVYIFPDAGCC